MMRGVQMKGVINKLGGVMTIQILMISQPQPTKMAPLTPLAGRPGLQIAQLGNHRLQKTGHLLGVAISGGILMAPPTWIGKKPPNPPSLSTHAPPLTMGLQEI